MQSFMAVRDSNTQFAVGSCSAPSAKQDQPPGDLVISLCHHDECLPKPFALVPSPEDDKEQLSMLHVTCA